MELLAFLNVVFADSLVHLLNTGVNELEIGVDDKRLFFWRERKGLVVEVGRVEIIENLLKMVILAQVGLLYFGRVENVSGDDHIEEVLAIFDPLRALPSVDEQLVGVDYYQCDLFACG